MNGLEVLMLCIVMLAIGFAAGYGFGLIRR